MRIFDVHLGPRSGHVRVRRGKGNKECTVPANVTARGYLSPWLDAAREEGARDEDWLFPTRRWRGRRGRAAFVLLLTAVRTRDFRMALTLVVGAKGGRRTACGALAGERRAR